MSIDIAANPYKQDFPLLAANPGLAFLDSAATAQRPAVALDAQRRFYEKMNANALRGLYRLSVDATEAIDEARAHVARFIGAADAREVVFCRNASEALNLVAKAFAPTVLEPSTRCASPSWSTTRTSSPGSRRAARRARASCTCSPTRTA